MGKLGNKLSLGFNHRKGEGARGLLEKSQLMMKLVIARTPLKSRKHKCKVKVGNRTSWAALRKACYVVLFQLDMLLSFPRLRLGLLTGIS